MVWMVGWGASRMRDELERIESREKLVTLAFSSYVCCCGFNEKLLGSVVVVLGFGVGSTKPRGAKSGIISAYVSATDRSSASNLEDPGICCCVGEISGLGAVAGVSAGSAERFVPSLLELDREWDDDVFRPRGGIGTGGMPLDADPVAAVGE